MEEKVRCFIAVDFPSEIIKEIARIQEVLSGIKFVGKLTELENLHLTLKFLGEIPKDKLELVKKSLREIKLEEFEANLDSIGTFSFKGKPKIVWIKIASKNLFELQKNIDSKLKDLSFPTEERFMSHLTIARIKYVKSPEGFKKYLDGLGVKNLKFTIKNFKLLKSDLKPLGPTYSLI